MSMSIRIYLSNLSRYVEGRENGRWIQLPMESTKLERIIREIVGENQEHIILDYSAPFEISEYEDITALNEFMESVEDCGINEDDLKAVFAVADTKEEAMKAIKYERYTIINVDEISSGWSTSLNREEVFGMVLNEEGYNNLFSQPIPEEMIDYMDFSQIYTCLSQNDGWRAVNIGNVTYLVALIY